MVKAARALPALVITFTLLASACNRQNAGGSGGTKTIQADGSSTVFLITQAIAEEYEGENTGVQVEVGIKGTGGGFERFCDGQTAIQDASREIKTERDPEEPDQPSESELCEQNNVEYVELTVAMDGLSVLAHPSNNWAECLSVDELKAIWTPGSTVDNWQDVRSEFPDKPLGKEELWGPGTDSGTFDYFTKEIVGEEGASRDNYSASENDDDLVTGVAANENALGYFGFGYYEQNTDKLKLLGVDSGDGCQKPTKETIQSNDYSPLSRPLFIYVSKEAVDRAEVALFVDFYLETVREIVADVGYVETPQDVHDKEVQEWEAYKTA